MADEPCATILVALGVVVIVDDIDPGDEYDAKSEAGAVLYDDGECKLFALFSLFVVRVFCAGRQACKRASRLDCR